MGRYETRRGTTTVAGGKELMTTKKKVQTQLAYVRWDNLCGLFFARMHFRACLWPRL